MKQLFPVNHKHVDGLSSDKQPPYTQLSLLEHYIRTTQLKNIVRSDLIAGDVTGQCNLAIDWSKSRRRVTELVRRNPIMGDIDGEDVTDLEMRDPTAGEQEETEEYDVFEEGPEIMDFATEDLAVLPPTCNDLQKATAVCLRLRYSADKVQEMVDEGVFILPPDTDIEKFCSGNYKGPANRRKSPDKRQAEDAGIKTEGTDKHALIFMVYTQLDFGAEDDEGEPIKQSGIIYYAGEDEIVGIIKNPLWSGKVPILSAPIERVKGSFFGKSKIEPVKFLQWNLCDIWNMGQDSAFYSMLPIWTVDPLRVPQWQSLTMGLAALWPAAPDAIKPMVTPALWKDAVTLCDGIKRQIWESLEVNEMMMGRMPQGRKNNQMMGQMQQDQTVNVTDHAERYEEAILSPLMELLFEFDQQFRTEEITIEARGEVGVKAALEVIPVQQWGERYFFRWCGTAYQMSMQRMQQQIAWVNVLKGIPPQLLGGKRLDISPMAEMGTENMFGPELAPRILIDERNMFTVDPDIENQIMHNNEMVEVHQADDHQAHLKSHMMAANLTGDPNGIFRQHMMMHMAAIKAMREQQMAQQQQMQKGTPGGPGGGPPGAAGAPRPGAQPGPQRPGGQNPAGAIQQDSMQGAPGRG